MDRNLNPIFFPQNFEVLELVLIRIFTFLACQPSNYVQIFSTD